MKITTWMFGKVRFFGFDNGESAYVVDELNNNYGAWRTAEYFRYRQQDGGEWTALGKIKDILIQV